MNTIQRLAVTVSLPLVAMLLTGCPAQTGPDSTTQPPAGTTAVLDTKALTPLAKLQPPIAKPVNSAPTTAPAGEFSVTPMLVDAEKKIAQKDFSSAREVLDRAVGFEPDNPRTRKDIGQVYVGLQNYGLAVENFTKALAVMPDDLETQLLLGKLQIVRERNDSALVALRTALLTSRAKPREPSAAETLLHLGDLLRRMGYYTASLDAYDQLNDWLQSNADAYTNNAALQPLLLQPEVLLVKRGATMLQLNKAGQAVKVLDKAYANDCGNAQITQLLAEALIRDKQYGRAETLILDLASQPAQQSQLAPLAQSLAVATGNKELPLKIWLSYVNSGKKDTALAMAMAEVAQKMGASQQAQAILESALEKQPGSAAVNKALVGLMIATGRYDQAVTCLATVVADDANQSIEAQRTMRQISSAAPADFHRQLARKYAADSTPRAAAAHYLCGILSAIRGDQAQAAAQYEQALRDDPNFLPVYEATIDLSLQQRQLTDAQKALERAGKLDDARFGYFKAYLRGKVNLAVGNMEGAIKDLESSRDLRGDYVPALIQLADAYLRGSIPTSDKSGDAARVMMEAVRAAPDNQDLYGMLVGLLLRKGQVPDAQLVLRQLMERRPDSITGKILQVEMLMMDQGKPEADRKAQAARMLEEIKKVAPGNAQVRWLDFQLAYVGKLDKLTDKEWREAVDRLRTIVKADSANLAVLNALAALLNVPNHRSQGAEIWAKVYEETNKPPLIAQAYADILYRDGKYDKVVEVLQSAMQTSSRDNGLRSKLLITLQKLKKNEEMAKLAEQWLRDARDDQERLAYRQMLMKFYDDSKQYDKAHKLLDDWILLAADSRLIQELRQRKLELYGKAGQYDKAVEYGLGWIAEARSDQQAARRPRFLLLTVLEDGKQYDKALALMTEFLAKDNEFKSFWQMQQILLLGQAGQLDKGRQIALDIIARNPADTDAREAVVVMYRRAQKFDQALALIDSWLAEAGKAAPAASGPAPLSAEVLDWCRISAVTMLIAQEKYNDAIRRADTYLPFYKNWKPKPVPPPPFPGARTEKPERNPSVELQIYKSNCLGELGQKDQQMAMLEKLIVQYPDDALLNNDLGYMYADRGANLDKAERMIRKALALEGDPPSPSVLDSLGWALYKQGKFADAMRIFDVILAMDEMKVGDTSVVFDHAGDVAFRVGNADKAVELWTTALDKARKEKSPSSDTKKVVPSAAAKIDAVKKGRPPAIAPLGQGVNPATMPAKK